MFTESCPATLAQSLLSNVSVDGTLGAGYIGVVLSAIVYGITCCQTLHYFRSERARRDFWALKLLVAVSMIASTAQEGAIIHTMYYMVITNYANPCFLLASTIWSIPAEVLIGGVIVLGVNGFLTYRTWKLGHNMYISTFCAMLTLTEFAINTVGGIKLLTFRGTIIADEEAQQHLARVSFGFSTGASITISGVLLYYLHRSRTGFRRSDGLINQIMVLTVSTGSVQAAVDLAQLIVYIIAPSQFYILLFNFLTAKVSLNALLTILNMRASLASSINKMSTSEGINSIPLRKLGLDRSLHSVSFPPEPAGNHDGKASSASSRIILEDKQPADSVTEDPFILQGAVFGPADSAQAV